jgi:hypothetical protein
VTWDFRIFPDSQEANIGECPPTEKDSNHSSQTDTADPASDAVEQWRDI